MWPFKRKQPDTRAMVDQIVNIGVSRAIRDGSIKLINREKGLFLVQDMWFYHSEGVMRTASTDVPILSQDLNGALQIIRDRTVEVVKH